jgi:predicted unusual protein kinase regulating ubiquinone biosynthesis (AarF/ABC1/UbiB family)
MGSIAAGIAGNTAASGLRQMASGQRPQLSSMLLTPANAMRLTEGLSHMRGAALKLGQMLSMDPGVVLPAEMASILASLQADARHMAPHQLSRVLDAEWGEGWRSRFARFDEVPFAAASIGQVHRAQSLDGRDLAIKVQYPGVRDSIDSDIDNIASLFRLPGLMPPGMDLAPLLTEAKRQLHDEADYEREAAWLVRFGALLSGSADFLVPAHVPEFSTPRVLAMSFVESVPLDALAQEPQETRDRVAERLIVLVMRELFAFRTMQTDPNLANYRFEPQSGRIVLLDFGAVRAFDVALSEDFRALLSAGLDNEREAIRAAMLKIGYFGEQTPAMQRELIIRMFQTAMVPLRQPTPFDFKASDLLERLRSMGQTIGTDRDLMHVPPAETLFLHRKIGGMYLLAAKLRARTDLGRIVAPYRAFIRPV